MSPKIWMKNKIINLKAKITSKIKEYFLFENSLYHLFNFIKNFYVFSIGFDDIYYGNKNPKRFKICILYSFVWLYGLSNYHFYYLINCFHCLRCHCFLDN